MTTFKLEAKNASGEVLRTRETHSKGQAKRLMEQMIPIAQRFGGFVTCTPDCWAKTPEVANDDAE